MNENFIHLKKKFQSFLRIRISRTIFIDFMLTKFIDFYIAHQVER